ncbi:MAG: hypothetical protein CMO55_10475 [Verrucomicrobiales bacterium]|nr:hypothetical protein [Verrucomicrobiales bacterium]
MSPRTLCRWLLLLLSFSLFTGCEKRQPSAEGDVEKTDEKQEVEVIVEAEKEPKPKPVVRKEPELLVTMEEDKIVVNGSLKSRIQIERIEQELGEAFSGTRIENNLVRDTSRYAVGWGNRVTELFLIPFLYNVKNGSVEYKEGIVTLKGDYTNPRDLKRIQEHAVVVFSGDFTKDIDNQMNLVDMPSE